jgi:hypothetical protein
MSKGKGIHGNSDSFETSLAELYGGIKQQIIFYSAEIGVSAGWVAERISSLLSPERAGVLHHLSVMRVETPTGSRAVEPLALAVNAHSSEAPSTVVGTTSEVANHSVSGNSKKGGWSKMTPKQRSAEMARRNLVARGKVQSKQKRDSNAARKRKRAEEKARLVAHGRKLSRNGRIILSPEERAAKQKIYVERSTLRAQGVPEDQLPPLPGKVPVNAVAN